MFNLETALSEWRKQMRARGIKQTEILDELECHLRENMARLQPEMRDAAAFEAAVRRLGDGKALKKEFAKVGRGFFQQLQRNPLGLNLLAAWLILIGADELRHWVRQIDHFLAWGTNWFFLLSTLMLILPILAGMGIFWRKNSLRYVAVSLLIFFVGIQALCFRSDMTRHDHLYSPVGVFLGLTIPNRFLWCYSLLLLGIFTSGLIYLIRNPVKKLFESNRQTRIA